MQTKNEDGKCGLNSLVFTWSPLVSRKQKDSMDEKKTKNSFESTTNYYPNCDVNVWLRSCETEIIEPLEGKITGKIPEWLNGSLIRNGPGSLKVGDSEFNHLFDSSALLHRFGIKDGRVVYQCRFLQSETFKKNRAANRIVFTEFGTKCVPDPCHTIFQRVASIFNTEESDNAMISIYPFGDELYAFNEAPIIHKINPDTLATEHRVKVSDYVAIVYHTSHPHVVKDGTVYNTGLSLFASGLHHIVVCFPKRESGGDRTMFEEAEIVATVPVRWPLHPSYMHTFGITENYFILVEQPLTVSIPSVVVGKLTNEPTACYLKWCTDENTQISVICRKLGRVSYKFYAEAFFYLHIIHQYEIDDHIVLDICIYRDASMLKCMYIENMKNMHQNPDYAKMFRGRPARFVLPLAPEPMQMGIDRNLVKLRDTEAKAYYLPNGEIFLVPERLCALGCETPRINYDHYLSKPYRYFYAISSDVDAENPGTMIKVDTYTKSAKTWCETNCYPSEPIFIPNPDPQGEDDGVVLAAMVWGWEDTNRAGLIILDARTFTEIARAEFTTPGPVPKCLHGWFLPQSKTADESII